MEKFLGKYTIQQLEEMSPEEIGAVWQSMSGKEQDSPFYWLAQSLFQRSDLNH